MSDLQDWIAQIYTYPELLGMGHAQSLEDLNLGLGWLYYALPRILRCQTVVVIGSYRGFVPLVLGRALQDNQSGGQLIFIDPSYVDDFWKDSKQVQSHFLRFGIDNIQHFLCTTQEFIKTEVYQTLKAVSLLFVDGYHTEDQARFDHEAFIEKLTDDAIVLFHDSTHARVSKIYGNDKAYSYSVINYINQLRSRKDLQVFDLPFDSGVTLVSRRSNQSKS